MDMNLGEVVWNRHKKQKNKRMNHGELRPMTCAYCIYAMSVTLPVNEERAKVVYHRGRRYQIFLDANCLIFNGIISICQRYLRPELYHVQETAFLLFLLKRKGQQTIPTARERKKNHPQLLQPPVLVNRVPTLCRPS